MNLSNYFQILLLFTQLRYLYGTVTQSPSFACAGESITVSCVLTVPNAGLGDVFDSNRPAFIIGSTNAALLEAVVDGTSYTNRFYLTRFTAATNAGNLTEVSGSITIRYYTDYEGLRIGCINQYRLGLGRASAPGTPTLLIQALYLVQAVPPSISAPIATIQYFNPSTCEGTLRFNLATTSDRDISYSILFNGNSIASNLPSSNTEFTHNTQFLLDTNYPTSIIATSCAGKSTDGDANVRINGYMQSNVSCAQYNNVTGALTIYWILNTPSQPTGFSGINIVYSVRATYSHSKGIYEHSYPSDTSYFNLMSTITTYDVPLIPHSFKDPQGVETNIIAHVRMLQQCGHDLVGTEFNCSFSSASNPTSPTHSVTTINFTNTTSPINQLAVASDSAVIGGAIGGIIAAIFVLSILLRILFCCIYQLKEE